MELVLGFVDGLEDKRTLRLVCKRSRSSVDSRVVAVDKGNVSVYREEERDTVDELSALVRAVADAESARQNARRHGRGSPSGSPLART